MTNSDGDRGSRLYIGVSNDGSRNDRILLHRPDPYQLI